MFQLYRYELVDSTGAVTGSVNAPAQRSNPSPNEYSWFVLLFLLESFNHTSDRIE